MALASTGGTITMTGDAGSGVAPTLDADDLLRAVPQLGAVATLQATTLCTMPGASLGNRELARILQWGRQTSAAGAVDGLVVVQGTDTLEETAYRVDLSWESDVPIVFTGAMRAAAAAGADGAANLLAAVRTAAAPEARGLGALVVMNDEVHAAVRVRKIDTAAVNAFVSPLFGLLGRVHEDRLTIANRLSRWPALPDPAAGRYVRVAIVEAVLGDRGELLQAVDAADFDGVVVAGFGVGHLSATAADVLGDVATRRPVVLASRTGGGPTFTGSYGFIGSERDLLGRGAIGAGWLDARKARLLLGALLESGADHATVRRTVTERGARPAGPGRD